MTDSAQKTLFSLRNKDKSDGIWRIITVKNNEKE